MKLDKEYGEYAKIVHDYLSQNNLAIYPIELEKIEMKHTIEYHASYAALGLVLLKHLAQIPETRAILLEALGVAALEQRVKALEAEMDRLRGDNR